MTDDPLLATGDEPGPAWMARAPLRFGGEVVAYRVRARKGAKPVVAHAVWRTSAEVAEEIVLGSTALAAEGTRCGGYCRCAVEVARSAA